MVVAASAPVLAQASPKATPTPRPFAYNGYVRAFYFTRTNRFQNPGNPNRAALNFGGKLHGEFHFARTPFTIGASYFGADPFGANGEDPGFRTDPLNCAPLPSPSCAGNGTRVSKVDNTLPGFPLSTLGEAWLQYKTSALSIKLGDQQVNYAWAPASDSRLKPALYEAADVQVSLSARYTLGIDRAVRFEHRTSSLFESRTLLTDAPASNPAYPIHETRGMLLAYLGYKLGTAATASVNYYEWYDVAQMLWLDAKISPLPNAYLKPYVAFQFGSERDSGAAYAGRINAQVVGMQLGASLTKNVDASVGFDHIPLHVDTVLGACATASRPYFLPAGGTPTCKTLSNHTAQVFYGGIASPYTEAYATDPLFTTSISQGMADRHSPGDSFKVATTWQSDNKRTKLVLSEALYDYGNPGGGNQTREFNADLTYFFNKVSSGPYRGLSLRHRYAERTQPTIPYDFKYNRTQLQYDF